MKSRDDKSSSASSGQRRGILIKCLINIPHLNECEYLGDVFQGADIKQGESLEEWAGPDHHQQLGEQVEVCLEMLHGSVVHQLLADLPGGGPPEEHIDQKQEENWGVKYGQGCGTDLG